MSGNSTETAALESRLWDNFCRLRLRSRAYRAIDDPIVAVAYSDWLASYLADSAAVEISTAACEGPRASNVIPFQKTGGRA